MFKVSVCLCHHKGDLILKAIQSLKAQKYVELEIIVATSAEDRVFYGTKTIFVKGGPANKRNVALRYATHDLIAFFDDDIEATPTAVYEMATTLNNEGVGAVFGKLLNMEHRDRFDEAGSYLTWSGFLWARAESGCKDTGQYEKIVPILAGKSASMMIRRNVFVEAGMFDVSYEILGEETDLAWRVWLNGWAVFYVPKSVTYHAFNTRFKPKDFYIPKRVYFNGCRNYISMLITNLNPLNLIVPLIVQVCVWLSASIGMILTGKVSAGVYILKGLWYVVCNLKQILHKRKTVQLRRKIYDADFFPFVTKNPPLSYYYKRFFHYIKTGLHG